MILCNRQWEAPGRKGAVGKAVQMESATKGCVDILARGAMTGAETVGQEVS